MGFNYALLLRCSKWVDVDGAGDLEVGWSKLAGFGGIYIVF